ncbi:MAG: ABC transporter substrate-binding protein [Acidobacteria bacterium]|nr:ABC transporter substrate-binding protein [Acidobacteriota bacterium]
MPEPRPNRSLLVVAVLALVLWVGWSYWPAGTPQPAGDEVAGAPVRGGQLRATYATEPTNFLRIAAPQPTAANLMFSALTQATLLRTDASGGLEPRLAERWSASPDGLTWTIDLRRDARFSDGTPVSSADVLFSMRAVLGTAAAADMRVGGQPLAVRAVDDHQVLLTFPAPHGPGLAILEHLPILPRHILEPALDAGQLTTIWAPSAPTLSVVGAGPFVLQEYIPAQRLRFVRNPHFFGRDDDGAALPYLDEIDMAIVPEANTELLRLQSGDADVITNFVAAEDLATLRQSEAEGRVQLTDAGPAVDVTTLWFNLRPGAAAGTARPWLLAPEFRRAISHAVNRQAIVDTVYLGEAILAYGPVTPGHGDWYVPDLPAAGFDVARARTLLTSMGLYDRNSDGMLDDESNQPVRFSIITRAGQAGFEKTMAVVQEHLRQVGVAVDVIALQQPEIISRYTSGDFDAIYFGGRATTRDPIGSMGFWMSSGAFHWWHPGQVTPATEWEARIDALMQQQAVTMDVAERRRLFAEAQHILAEQMPALWFVAPRQVVAVSGRVRGAVPQIFFPPVLWNAERLSLVAGGQ